MSEKKELSTLQSIAQARAKYAWECAEKSKQDKSKEKEYASLARKIPMYIKTNGLLNTVAFLYSKNEREKQVLNDIMNWLTHEKYGIINKKDIENISEVKEVKEKAEKDYKHKPTYEEKFIEYLIKHEDPRSIILYTTEILALFTWLRRFVKAEEEE